MGISISGSGGEIHGLDIVCRSGYQIRGAKLVNCMIDDVTFAPFDDPVLVDCVLEKCTFKSSGTDTPTLNIKQPR